MRALVRLVAVWLVVLALPLQGWAAATMLHCGSGHAPGHPSSHSGSRGAGDRGGHAVHHHAAGHGAHAVQHAHAAHDPHDPHDLNHAGGSHDEHRAQHSHAAAGAAGELGMDDHAAAAHKCSACAACCLGVGLPASTPRLDVIAASQPPVACVAEPALSYIASGPERPPRSFLA